MIRRLVITMVVSIVAATTLIASVPTKRDRDDQARAVGAGGARGDPVPAPHAQAAPTHRRPDRTSGQGRAHADRAVAVDWLAIVFTLAPSQQERIRRSAHIQLGDSRRRRGRAGERARSSSQRPSKSGPRSRRPGGFVSDSTLATALRTARVVLDEVERAVIGKRDVLELVLMGSSPTATSSSTTCLASRRP